MPAESKLLDPINVAEFRRTIQQKVTGAQFAMLRYETEFTPCTGITAVTKQERRHFSGGVMISPWCSSLKREKPENDPLKNGKVCETGWAFNVSGIPCNVLATTDEFAPIIFLKVDGRFRGRETPYDTPPEPPDNDSLATLRRDTLYFGLAVHEFIKKAAMPKSQFIWGADWETVPALSLLRHEHHISLTLHNTFDECLEKEADAFGTVYTAFRAPRRDQPARTALQVGLEIADVITTVNKGFAEGMRTEELQKSVMAKHLQPLLQRVVGIDNAAFATLGPELTELRRVLISDFEAGRKQLFDIKKERLEKLPERVQKNAADRAIVVSMGRRVSQKQHDVLVESLREILTKDNDFPVLAIFATVHGDSNSPAILARIKALEAEFPSNVVCEDGQLGYYKELMAAADFNCMPSLYEPHGGAYEGTVIPIARAVDGLAEQICGLNPRGIARSMNDRWHRGEQPTGFLFREEATPSQSSAEQLESLLKGSPFSCAFRAMRDSLAAVLREAVDLRLKHDDEYARLVLAALRKQEGWTWQQNLTEMLELMEEAQKNRNLV